jgi:hypothetical protein
MDTKPPTELLDAINELFADFEAPPENPAPFSSLENKTFVLGYLVGLRNTAENLIEFFAD